MKSFIDLILEASTHQPPAGVKAACAKGLKLKDDHGGDGLTPAAVAWARKIANGEPVSHEKLRKMHAYFARHKVDKKANWHDPPTPGYVAWQLWGGDAGRSWSHDVVQKMEEAKRKTPKWKKQGLVGAGGAAKTAERQAAKQGKKSNAAYKSAIYAKMTKKK